MQLVHIFCDLSCPSTLLLVKLCENNWARFTRSVLFWTKLTRPHLGYMFRMRLTRARRFPFPSMMYGSLGVFSAQHFIQVLKQTSRLIREREARVSKGLRSSRPHSNLMKKQTRCGFQIQYFFPTTVETLSVLVPPISSTNGMQSFGKVHPCFGKTAPAPNIIPCHVIPHIL